MKGLADTARAFCLISCIATWQGYDACNKGISVVPGVWPVACQLLVVICRCCMTANGFSSCWAASTAAALPPAASVAVPHLLQGPPRLIHIGVVLGGVSQAVVFPGSAKAALLGCASVDVALHIRITARGCTAACCCTPIHVQWDDGQAAICGARPTAACMACAVR